MAVDTQQKRMSAAGAGRPYMRAHFPGTINQAWRIAAGIAYAGNPLAGTNLIAATGTDTDGYRTGPLSVGGSRTRGSAFVG